GNWRVSADGGFSSNCVYLDWPKSGAARPGYWIANNKGGKADSLFFRPWFRLGKPHRSACGAAINSESLAFAEWQHRPWIQGLRRNHSVPVNPPARLDADERNFAVRHSNHNS